MVFVTHPGSPAMRAVPIQRALCPDSDRMVSKVGGGKSVIGELANGCQVSEGAVHNDRRAMRGGAVSSGHVLVSGLTAVR